MNEDSWQQIQALYRQALSYAPEKRAVYLKEACAGNEDVRREVEVLLANDEHLIELPAQDAAEYDTNPLPAEAMTFQMPLTIPVQIGPYKLQGALGKGGMGEVFLALDTRLHRKVAIKVLPKEFTGSSERVRRFAQEACAASALNHPNILTIYDIGESVVETTDTHYIVTEYVEGETLRQKMSRASRQPMQLSEMLDIVSQVTAAIAAAHEAGIIHRDIKPENVMVRHDGLVKVVDFGLAKLVEHSLPPADSQANTLLHNSTEIGVILGTPRYMSPEQACGEKVDSRTDIFSVGVMLYEMLTGRAPFLGNTANEVIAAILRDEPPSLADTQPPELQHILHKALNKERSGRYQTATAMLADLNECKQQISIAKINSAPTVNTNIPTSQVTVARQPVRRRLALVALASIVLLVAGIGYFSLVIRKNEQAINSLAVLPFVNVGADPNLEYLSDGISESLINSLSQLPPLKVIARSSSFKYKGKDADPQEVARTLGVEAILTGRVLQRGEQLQISVELTDARDNTQMWGEQYNRKAIDLLLVQAEISREIANKLRLKLTAPEQQQLAKRETVNAEAYELILRGRAQREMGRPENLKEAVELFKRAIALDPSYALAHAELSIIYGLLTATSLLNPKEYLPQSQAEARLALALDANLADAHYALANAEMNQLNWPAAGAAFERALELNPNLARARWRHALYLSIMGQHDQAIAEAERARELSPLSPRFKSYVSIMLMNAGRSDEAIKVLQNTLALDPNSREALTGLGYIYLAKGMYAESITAFQQTIKSGYAGMSTQIYLGAAYARAGERNKALVILKQLQTSKEYVSPCELAVLYVALDQREEAFASLERAYAERDAGLGSIRNERGFDSIRSDPRFTNLMRRVGLPQ